MEVSGYCGRWVSTPSSGPSGIFNRGLWGTRGSRVGIREDYPNAGVYVRLTSDLNWVSGYGASAISGALDDIRGPAANWGWRAGPGPPAWGYDSTGHWIRWEPD